MNDFDVIKVRPFFLKQVEVDKFWHQPLVLDHIDLIDAHNFLLDCCLMLGQEGVNWDASVPIEEEGLVRMLRLKLYFKEETMQTHFLLARTHDGKSR